MKLKHKRTLCTALILLAAICALSAMTKAKGAKSASKKSAKIEVVTTIFPVYDWIKEIAGDADISLTMLQDRGTDLHNYQPTFQDIAKISKCDVFIYVGGESDFWVSDALKESRNPNMKTLNLMASLGSLAREEEEKEGMECEHEHEDEDDEEEEEYDEHIWLSLKNASVLCEEICKVLSSADTANSAKYKANTASYTSKIRALDSKYEAAAKSAKNKTLVFADRFPFLYLTSDYGLDYFAAFKGCSAESEASFKTVMFLSNKLDELKLSKVFTIETSDGKLAQTVIKNSKDKSRKILVMNSMQSVGKKEIAKGATYLSIMEKNLEALKEGIE